MFTQLQLPVRRYDSLDGSDLIGGGLMDLPFEDFQDNVRPSAGLRGLTKECAVAPVCVCDGGCSHATRVCASVARLPGTDLPDAQRLIAGRHSCTQIMCASGDVGLPATLAVDSTLCVLQAPPCLGASRRRCATYSVVSTRFLGASHPRPWRN